MSPSLSVTEHRHPVLHSPLVPLITRDNCAPLQPWIFLCEMTDVPLYFTSLQKNPCFFLSAGSVIISSRHRRSRPRADSKLSMFSQITRNHYQNALTATKMDSSPQTPEAVDPDAKRRSAVPEARSNSIALPLTHAHTRLGLARLAHLHPLSGLRSTCKLNERNRIVRKWRSLEVILWTWCF